MARSVVAVVVRPRLWATGVVQLFRLASPGWWRRWPPTPLPDPSYLRFRLQTQYGDPDRDPVPGDLVDYLEWSRGYRRAAR